MIVIDRDNPNDESSTNIKGQKMHKHNELLTNAERIRLQYRADRVSSTQSEIDKGTYDISKMVEKGYGEIEVGSDWMVRLFDKDLSKLDEIEDELNLTVLEMGGTFTIDGIEDEDKTFGFVCVIPKLD